MTYREPWVAKILGDRSVLQVALDVHMTAIGSYVRSAEEQDNDVRALKRVIEQWRFSIGRFDDAVHEVIEAALEEHEELITKEGK